MNLGELLDELREGILSDRSDRQAGTSDYLWTDTRLVRYIDEAQRRLALRGLVLRDGSTDAVTKVTLVAGQAIYPLHTSVLSVISARVQSSPDTWRSADLTRVGHCALAGLRQWATDTWTDPANYVGNQPGPPLAFSTDEELGPDDNDSVGDVQLRIYPVPSAAAAGTILRLRVVRLPINRFSVADITDPDVFPEIPETHHLNMLDWAAYLALRVVDDDAGNPKRAAEFAAAFEAHVKEARMEAMRKLFAPTTWGFGRGGFSWER